MRNNMLHNLFSVKCAVVNELKNCLPPHVRNRIDGMQRSCIEIVHALTKEYLEKERTTHEAPGDNRTLKAIRIE